MTYSKYIEHWAQAGFEGVVDVGDPVSAGGVVDGEAAPATAALSTPVGSTGGGDPTVDSRTRPPVTGAIGITTPPAASETPPAADVVATAVPSLMIVSVS